MDLNLATTVSFCAAATCGSLSALGVYLSRAAATRHFQYAAAAGTAGGIYCVTNAMLAGRMSLEATLFAGRLGTAAACIHGAAWLAFLVAWEKRAFTRHERAMVIVVVACALVSFVPGAVERGGVTLRSIDSLGITYSDPDFGPLGLPIVALSYATHVAAALAALRMSRHNRRARLVAFALVVFCVVIPIDTLSSAHVVSLPYLADPAVAFVLLSIGSVVVRDASESAEKTAELGRARIALAERDNLAALGQLAAVVAHEVRNPVAIIFGALANIRRASHSAEDEKLLEIVREEAERLEKLVTRLLDAVRPFELQYSRRRIHDLLGAAVAQVTKGMNVASSEVALAAIPDEDVECDDVLLVQAVANLMQNAVTAAGRRSPVRVSAAIDDASPPPMLRIEIADDGEGVPPDAVARLFTPFFTTRATGTGLGLALVKRIAGAHGGTVEHRPSDGRGATFVLRVPLRARDAVPRRLVGADVG